MGDFHNVYQTWHMTIAKNESLPRVTTKTPSHPPGCSLTQKRSSMQTQRIKSKMSISALAQRVGIDPETLAAFERGTDMLSAETIQSLEHELEMAN
ncbi:MAG: hypothetical protein CMM02_08185 [Rhodopirellula sp.]|nr:hypothetical protein [Rhodopirellula sp.]MAT10972.1 hypothetical protein [Rhodopirellula sp.]